MNKLNKNITVFQKRTIIFFLLFFALSCVTLMAGDNSSGANFNISGEFSNDLGNSGLTTVLKNIIGFFGSWYLKGICLIALGGLCLKILTSGGEPGLFKKFIPWIVGIGLLLSLSFVVNLIWSGQTAAGVKL